MVGLPIQPVWTIRPLTHGSPPAGSWQEAIVKFGSYASTVQKSGQGTEVGPGPSRRPGGPAKEIPDRPAPERQDGLGGRDLHRADLGAVGLGVASEQRILGGDQRRAGRPAGVAAVGLEREGPV